LYRECGRHGPSEYIVQINPWPEYLSATFTLSGSALSIFIWLPHEHTVYVMDTVGRLVPGSHMEAYLAQLDTHGLGYNFMLTVN
jgi:hypothetical protein